MLGNQPHFVFQDPAVLIDQPVANTYYVGLALPGTPSAEPKWQIRRVIDDGNGGLDVKFADGDNSFDNVWNNRTSLTYS